MAGEIFIAKEATSQDIKTIVDANGVALSSLSTNLATVNTNINTANTNINTVKTDVAANKTSLSTLTTNLATLTSNVAVVDSVVDSISAGKIDGSKYRSTTITGATITTLTKVLGVTGAGQLRTAFLYNATAGYARIKIVIDGTTMLDLSSETLEMGAFKAIGIMCQYPSTLDVDGTTYPLGISSASMRATCFLNATRFLINSASMQSMTDDGGCLFAPTELIRFNNSLDIYIRQEVAGGILAVEYYLG